MRCSLSGATINSCSECVNYGMCYGPVYDAVPEETRCILCGGAKDAQELTHGICLSCKSMLFESKSALAAYALEHADDFVEFCSYRAQEGGDLL